MMTGELKYRLYTINERRKSKTGRNTGLSTSKL
jgi:hypothetical protein